MVKTAQALTVIFTTADASTGAATDADSTPTGTLYVDGTANGASVTVTNITTGVYKAALTLPALTAGQVVCLRIAATVDSTAGEGVVFCDIADTSYTSEVKTDTAAVLADTNELQTDWANGGRLDVLLDSAASPTGSGAVEWEYTVTDGEDPIAGVHVWVTTDEDGNTIVADGYTDANGLITFNLDAGTYYFWSEKDGYNATNPDTEVVA